MATIQRGELNQRITLLEPKTADDKIGSINAKTYTAVRSCWAKLVPIFGMKLTDFRRSNFKATHECSIDFADWVTPQHRVCWHGDEYAIETLINVDNANETLRLTLVRTAVK